jgi:hypothetical protein
MAGVIMSLSNTTDLNFDFAINWLVVVEESGIKKILEIILTIRGIFAKRDVL